MKHIFLAGALYVGFHSSQRNTRLNTFDGPRNIYAISILKPDGDSGVHGLVKLHQQGNQTRIQATISGLTGTCSINTTLDGKHGFHIHEYGNLTKGCVTAGPHYNPNSQTHGGPEDTVRHVGDLGNIESSGGIAKYYHIDSLITLEGQNSVVGRAFVVHDKEDDLGRTNHPDSKTTGNAGARLACGVIGLSGPLDFD